MNPFPLYATVTTEKTIELSKRGSKRVFLSHVETEGMRFLKMESEDPEILSKLVPLKPHKNDQGVFSVQLPLFDDDYELLKPSEVKRMFSSIVKDLENIGYRVR